VTFRPEVSPNRSEIDPTISQAINRLATGKGEWPLLIYGPVGTGKTYAAVAALDRFGGVYHTASGFPEKLILADDRGIQWHRDGESGVWRSENLWRHIRLAALVVVDELGSRGVPTPTQKARLQELMDSREGRPLILISNLTPEELCGIYDERIMSRALRGTLAKVEGQDRRIFKS